jgi:hypothetical protein
MNKQEIQSGDSGLDGWSRDKREIEDRTAGFAVKAVQRFVALPIVLVATALRMSYLVGSITRATGEALVLLKIDIQHKYI